MQEVADLRTWTPAGPVAREYGRCPAPVCAIVGPTGGGKTTESSRRYLRVASWQHPSPIDGVRKARVLCICPTYRRAWDQIMPSFFTVFPKEGAGASFTGSRGDPANWTYDIEVSNGRELRRVHLEVLFRAVNDLDIEDFFRGFLFTAIHLPEADTNGDLAQILSLGSNRLGRYPEPHDRPDQADSPAYAGIWCDANAPVIGSAFHTRFYMRKLPSGLAAPPSDRLFVQPGGRSQNRENQAALRKIRGGRDDYYDHMAAGLDPYDVGRLIDNRPGFSRHGMPVHPNFDHSRHVSAVRLEPDPGLTVFVGVDCGSNTLHPAATFSQRAYSGQWRTLAEIYLPEGQMNLDELGAEILRVLGSRFGKLRRDTGAVLCLDPAAGGRNAASEFTTAAYLQAVTQIEAQLAPSQKPEHRRGQMDALFKRMIAPGEPAKIIDPDCVGLIGGYTGGFHYETRGGRVSPQPIKNRYSDVCEADEYALLTADGLPAGADGFIRLDGRMRDSGVGVILPD
jgi:hypothetical protein